MPVLIEVAAVDSGGGRRWHFGASRPHWPASLPAQPEYRVHGRWLTPCIALHTPDAGPAAHQTPYCSTCFFCCVALARVYGWRLSLRYRQAPGWRTVGSLATELSRWSFRRVVHTQSPEEVSGVPNSQPAAAHIRCTRCTTELLLEMRCVCDEILETGEQFLVSHLLGNLDRNVEGASLLLVEHPPVWPRCPMHFISVQLCPIDTETRSARALHSEESNRPSGTANNRPASCQTIPTQSKQAKHNPDNRSSPGTNLSLVW